MRCNLEFGLLPGRSSPERHDGGRLPDLQFACCGGQFVRTNRAAPILRRGSPTVNVRWRRSAGNALSPSVSNRSRQPRASPRAQYRVTRGAAVPGERHRRSYGARVVGSIVVRLVVPCGSARKPAYSPRDAGRGCRNQRVRWGVHGLAFRTSARLRSSTSALTRSSDFVGDLKHRPWIRHTDRPTLYGADTIDGSVDCYFGSKLPLLLS